MKLSITLPSMFRDSIMAYTAIHNPSSSIMPARALPVASLAERECLLGQNPSFGNHVPCLPCLPPHPALEVRGKKGRTNLCSQKKLPLLSLGPPILTAPGQPTLTSTLGLVRPPPPPAGLNVCVLCTAGLLALAILAILAMLAWLFRPLVGGERWR